MAGVILAAGASSRMGTPKPLLSLGSRGYLETVSDTLAAAGLAARFAVLGNRADDIWRAIDAPGLVRVDNPAWREGMLGSWRAGLAAVALLEPQHTAAVVALVDIPRFAAATVWRLIDAHRATGAPIVLPRHAGRHGHPVLVARSVWPELETAPQEHGARAVLAREPSRVLSVDVDDPWILRDADTPEEHARLLLERQ